ncbi:MAG: ferrous iron transport protein, partial [Firmicutes bacterium]|nr:ferrous iron transport protein [Bacillota bacterium]
MRRQMLLVGNPNVGKSVIFNRLTGRYVNVSNYPGTTVEVANGQSRIAGQDYEVIDTPGMYSLSPLTAEEEVTRQLLFSKNPAVVVQVLDAKNIRRMLNLTLQLIAAGLPVVVDLNLMDEARRQGVSVNVPLLAEVLGVPVVATTAVEKNGLQSLKQAIGTYRYHNADRFKFSEPIEQAVSAIVEKLTPEYIVAKRMVALLLLEDDKAVNSMVAREAGYNAIVEIINTLAAQYAEPLALTIAVERQKIVDALIRDVVAAGQLRRPRFFSKLDRLTREPLTGVPILAVVLYFGLYKIVGGFGAGVLVDYINENIFGV